MKKFLSTIILFFIFGVLVLYLYFVELKKEENIIFKLDRDEIAKIEIIKNNRLIRLENKNNNWFIKPQDYEVDENMINNMLDELEELNYERKLEKVDNLRNYGLDNENFKIMIYNKKNELLKTLIVGKETQLGNNTYIRERTSHDVYLIASYKIEKFKTDINQLRDKKLLRFKKEDINIVRIIRGNKKYLFKKTKSSWENEKIDSLLTEIKFLFAQEFISDSLPYQKLKEYNLLPAKYEIHLIDKNKKEYKLFLGKEKDNKIYAKSNKKRFVCLINRNIIDRINEVIK